MTIYNAPSSWTATTAKARATVTAAALLMTLSAGLAFAQDPNNGAMPGQAGDNGAAQAPYNGPGPDNGNAPPSYDGNGPDQGRSNGPGDGSGSGVARLQSHRIATGTALQLTLLDDVNSGSAQIGDTVRARVADDDRSGLPVGTIMIGHVVGVNPAGSQRGGSLDVQFGIPNQTPGARRDADSSTTLSVPDAASAHFGAQNAKSANSSATGIGAGAGALLGLSRKRKLGDAVAGGLLGALGGYAVGQSQKRNAKDVSLTKGTEITTHLDSSLVLRTEIVAPY